MQKFFFSVFLIFVLFFVVWRSPVIAQVDEGVGAAKTGINAVGDLFYKDAKEKDEDSLGGLIDTLTKDPETLTDSTLTCGGLNQACCLGSNTGQTTLEIPGIPGGSVPIVGGAVKKFNEKIQSLFKSSTKEIQNEIIGNLKCFEGHPKNDEEGNPSTCKCRRDPSTIQALCSYISNTAEQEKCKSHTANSAVWTALGPIDFTLKGFITDTLFRLGVGIAGVVALLCIIYSAFVMQTSGGNPEKLKRARAQLTACIMGLFLIIFSIFILRVIGVDILQIPGF